MASENVATAKSVYDALGRGDIPGVLMRLDANIQWEEPLATGLPAAGIHQGQQAVANEVLGIIPTYYERLTAVPQEFVEVGDRVFVLGEFWGKAKATGTRFVASFVHIFTFSSTALVSRFQDYTDTGTIVTALNFVAVVGSGSDSFTQGAEGGNSTTIDAPTDRPLAKFSQTLLNVPPQAQGVVYIQNASANPQTLVSDTANGFPTFTIAPNTAGTFQAHLKGYPVSADTSITITITVPNS
jgi:ketosteroid isomerase-like protein